MEASAPRKAPEKSPVEQRLVAAVAHSLRHQIFTILVERTASPNEIATELDEELGKVAYHVRVLRDFDLIELVDTRPARGSTEHYYRSIQPTTLHNREWGQLSLEEREGYSLWASQLFISDMARAMEKRTFDRRLNRHLTRSLPEVDEVGWNDVADLLDATFDRIAEIAAESATRAADEGSELFPATAALFLFERGRYR